MKKLISILLCACMILTSMAVFAAAPTAKSYESNISVYGKVDASREGDAITIVMVDNNTSLTALERTVHVGMTETKVGGYYQYKFKFTMPAGKSLADYTLKAKIGDDDITDTIISAETDKANAFDVSLRMDAYFTPEVTITNKLDGETDAKVILASYTNDGELVATKIVDTTVPYDQKGKGHVVNVAELGGDYIKAFMWDDAISPIPMAKNDVTNTALTPKFEDGDVVTFTGSSSMHLSTMPALVDHFYQTRYPDMNVTILNTGVGGDSVAKVLARYDWDVSRGEPNRTYLICGGNDIGYWNFTEEDQTVDADDVAKIEACLGTYDTFIAKMREEGLEMVLLGTAPFDYGANYEGAVMPGDELWHPGADNAIRILSAKLDEKVAALENNDDVKRIDFYNYVDQITKDARKDDPNAKALASYDRIHMEKYGYYVQGVLVLLAQGHDEVVSTVDINVADVKNANIENAAVTVKEATSSKVAYTYDPNSLPLGLCQWYKDAEKFYPVTEKLNQEIIRIKGLEEGTYTITFTGEDDAVYTLGSYTNAELAKGVNIAINEYNPGQIQAAAAMAKQVTRQSKDEGVRAMVAPMYKAGTDKDPEAFATWLEGYNVKKDAAYEYSTQARALSTPKTYEVVIEKN